MLLEAVGGVAYAALLGALGNYTFEKAVKVRELCLALSRENAAARTIQHAFRTHLKKFWWWRVAFVREEARARNVAVRDVLRHITMLLKRLEAARKIQHWVRTRAPSMLSDTYSDSCDDDSSFDSDSDSEGPMTSQCNAGAAQESLVATTVDPLSPAGKEGLRIILTRLDGKSGTEMVDPAIIMKEALMQQTLFVSLRAAGTFHVFSGLQLVKCNGPALEILGCGSIRRSGGGRAVLQAAAAYARQRAFRAWCCGPFGARPERPDPNSRNMQSSEGCGCIGSIKRENPKTNPVAATRSFINRLASA